MKVGSLVKVIHKFNIGTFPLNIQINIKWLPKIGEIYTIREILEDPYDRTPMIFLEENSAGTHPDEDEEFGFDMGAFIEVQSPMDVQSLICDILENY